MFLIFCNNKGCGEYQSPNLDVATNEVICSSCGKPITTVTSFAKTQLKAMGQIKRTDNKQKAFAVQCKECKNVGQPKIVKKDDQEILVCNKCGSPLLLSKPYRHVVLEFLKNNKGG